jgi:hypothetical protein
MQNGIGKHLTLGIGVRGVDVFFVDLGISPDKEFSLK